MRRLFFALWPPDDACRGSLDDARRPYIATAKIRPVDAANLHLTLAFIGEVNDATQDCLQRAAVAIQVNAFTLSLDYICNWRHNGILWAGSHDAPQCESLHKLVRELRQVMRQCKLKPEKRPYQAHVTLARHCYHGPTQATPITPLHWPCTRFVLVESKRHAEGLIYAPIQAWPLPETQR
jgi:2'-5' RNA ligase